MAATPLCNLILHQTKGHIASALLHFKPHVINGILVQVTELSYLLLVLVGHLPTVTWRNMSA